MYVTIRVKDEDIKQGIRRNGSFCPVALAARRILGTKVITNRYQLSIVPNNHTTIKYPAPVEVTEFVDAFDADKKVEPFAFEIDMNKGVTTSRDGFLCDEITIT